MKLARSRSAISHPYLRGRWECGCKNRMALRADVAPDTARSRRRYCVLPRSSRNPVFLGLSGPIWRARAGKSQCQLQLGDDERQWQRCCAMYNSLPRRYNENEYRPHPGKTLAVG